MRTLQENINAARYLLTEANLVRVPAVGVANQWRDCVRMGDEYLSLMTDAASAAARAAKAEDPLTARRANADVSSEMRKFLPLTEKFYGAHRTGMTFLEEVGKLFNNKAYRKWPKANKLAALSNMTDDEVRKELEKATKDALKKWRAMLETGASASRRFREAAKMRETPTKEYVDSLIEEGLDFRDEVGITVYARTNGIVRRVVELSNRAWEAMALESRLQESAALVWDPPWKDEIPGELL